MSDNFPTRPIKDLVDLELFYYEGKAYRKLPEEIPEVETFGDFTELQSGAIKRNLDIANHIISKNGIRTINLFKYELSIFHPETIVETSSIIEQSTLKPVEQDQYPSGGLKQEKIERKYPGPPYSTRRGRAKRY